MRIGPSPIEVEVTQHKQEIYEIAKRFVNRAGAELDDLMQESYLCVVECGYYDAGEVRRVLRRYIRYLRKQLGERV